MEYTYWYKLTVCALVHTSLHTQTQTVHSRVSVKHRYFWETYVHTELSAVYLKVTEGLIPAESCLYDSLWGGGG